MKELAKKTQSLQESIFATIAKEANKENAINLSQGFPGFDGPKFLKDYLKEAITNGFNQYSPSTGVKELRSALTAEQKRAYGLHYNEDTDVLITAGATQGIYLAINTIVDQGDEVLLVEPFYDSYKACVELVGGKPVATTLRASSQSKTFELDFDDLKKKISPKTKLIIINNPHNPTGKVFTQSEMKNFEEALKNYDGWILSDEVYEHLVFDDKKHIPTASLESLREKTITLGSGGKTFGMTGWKVGWALGPKEVIKQMTLLHQYNVFSIHTPTQYAYAKGVNNLKHYLKEFTAQYQSLRDLLVNGLIEKGHDVYKPHGTYFAFVDVSSIQKEFKLKTDVDTCMHFIHKYKIAAIPPSSFYLNEDAKKESMKFLRFCFAKSPALIEDALSHFPSR